jgi:hypothetical protein
MNSKSSSLPVNTLNPKRFLKPLPPKPQKIIHECPICLNNIINEKHKCIVSHLIESDNNYEKHIFHKNCLYKYMYATIFLKFFNKEKYNPIKEKDIRNIKDIKYNDIKEYIREVNNNNKEIYDEQFYKKLIVGLNNLKRGYNTLLYEIECPICAQIMNIEKPCLDRPKDNPIDKSPSPSPSPLNGGNKHNIESYKKRLNNYTIDKLKQICINKKIKISNNIKKNILINKLIKLKYN